MGLLHQYNFYCQPFFCYCPMKSADKSYINVTKVFKNKTCDLVLHVLYVEFLFRDSFRDVLYIYGERDYYVTFSLNLIKYTPYTHTANVVSAGRHAFINVILLPRM